jgi:hypothetical protein
MDVVTRHARELKGGPGAIAVATAPLQIAAEEGPVAAEIRPFRLPIDKT